MPALLSMFPGQGSQTVGMGKELLKQFPKAKRLFEEAEDSIHLSIRKLCLEGPADELELTANQQPCILTLSVAIWQVLKEEAGIQAQYFAGHSLGEYSALVASGKLAFGQAVYLVRKRGEAMQEAVAPGLGAMAAVLGADPTELLALCRQESQNSHLCVDVVNFNSPAQQIISGHKQAVEGVCAQLLSRSIKTLPLPVSAPFHSSLMAPARQAMEPLLRELSLAKTAGQMIANLTGEVEPNYDSKLLLQQIDSPVLWTKSLTSAYNAGVRTCLEVGPGRVLFGLARRCLDREVKLLHTADLNETIAELAKLP